MLRSTSPTDALFWGRVLFLAAIFIPLVHSQATLAFIGREEINRKVLFAGYILASLFVSFDLWSHILISDVRPILDFKYYTRSGYLMYPFLLFFSAIVLFTLVELYNVYRTSPLAQKSAVFYVALSWVIGYAGGSTSFLPTFGLAVYPYGVFVAPIYFLITGYAIVKYRFMDISTVVHKTVMWIATLIIVLLPISILFNYFKDWITSLGGVNFSILVLVSFSVMIPYLRFVQPRIDHFFQRRQYNMQRIIQSLIRELATLSDLDVLVGKLIETIKDALYISNVSAVLWNDKINSYEIFKEAKLRKKFDVDSYATFFSWMKQQDKAIEFEELNFSSQSESLRSLAREYFSEVEAQICLPLVHNKEMIGVINLGKKDNLKAFSKMDLDFLSNLRAEACIALSNSLLYDDVQKMSEELRRWARELEQKVEERTSELSESKAELERSYQKLQELDNLKSQFFANISHELRTPLTLILAPLESYLHEKNTTGRQSKDFEIMYHNGLRLLKQINNLLDLAKIDAGKMQLSYAKTDLVGFVKGIVASVGPLAEKKGISLSSLSDSNTIEFNFDRDKVERVLLNLIFNALKFTDSGGTVKVSCYQEREQVLVKIEDSGIGITKENIPKLFNRFSQIDSSASRRYEGTGVGLALVKELVELHKGKIWAESEAGRGTVMTFSLPFLLETTWAKGEVNTGRTEEDWTRSLQRSAEYSTSGILQEPTTPVESVAIDGSQQNKVLLVEDNPDMLHFIVAQLRDNHQVITARNGMEGVRRAKEELPDLILSDIMMPLKDGYQLCREVKEDPTTKHIPVILLSAKADLSMKIEGLEYGADDYLTKPFSSEELRARVKSLLNLRALESEIQSRSAELELALRELRSTQEQLVHSEKMAALGLLVAGLAHEINNPVTFAKGSLSNLRRSLEELQGILAKDGVSLKGKQTAELVEDIQVSLSIIRTGLERTEAIVGDLKSFVRKDEVFFKPTDVHEGIDTTLNLLKPELGNRIFVVKEYGEIGLVEAIPGRINQVFMNLLQNAIHAIRETGEIRIRTWKEQVKESNGEGEFRGDNLVKISVKDSGVGISEENLKHIFEPFFTTKEVGKGMGLGLSLTYQIIRSHDGEIKVNSAPGVGTEVILALPVHHAERPQPDFLQANFGN